MRRENILVVRLNSLREIRSHIIKINKRSQIFVRMEKAFVPAPIIILVVIFRNIPHHDQQEELRNPAPVTPKPIKVK